MTKKTIITYGTFDMFHIGHLRLIQRIQQLGDTLIVGVSSDEFNHSKGKKCIIPFEQRAEIVRNIVGVDLVIAENSWEQKINDIEKFNVDLLVMGNDWEGKFDYLLPYCDVRYLPRTKGISTTEIKKILATIDPNLKKNINNLLKILESIRDHLI